MAQQTTNPRIEERSLVEVEKTRAMATKLSAMFGGRGI
jgi:hypothetical protein